MLEFPAVILFRKKPRLVREAGLCVFQAGSACRSRDTAFCRASSSGMV